MVRHISVWLLIIASGVAGAVAAKAYLQKGDSNLFSHGKDFPEVLYLIEQAYVDKIGMGKLMPGAFQGALESLDENACYIPAEEQTEFLSQQVFDQTGMVVVKQNGYPYIMHVAKGSAADTAGIAAQNYIRGINTATARKKSIHRIHQLLLAEPTFTLGVLPPGQLDDKQVTMTSAPFEPARIAMEDKEDLHLLRFTNAYEGMAQDLDAALAKLGDTDKLVLDLRANALGGLDMMQLLCDRFLPKGELAWWLDKQKNKTVIATKEDPAFKGQLYILTDHTTSGGAELFAAIAREKKAARLVGETTLSLPFWYETFKLKNGGTIRISTRDLMLAEDKRFTGKGIKIQLKTKVEGDQRSNTQAFLDEALKRVRTDDGSDPEEDTAADEKASQTDEAPESENPPENN